jgi:hypothetical protein
MLYNKAPHNLYYSQNIIKVISLSMMTQVGHSMHGGDEKCIQAFGHLKGRENLKDKAQIGGYVKMALNTLHWSIKVRWCPFQVTSW